MDQPIAERWENEQDREHHPGREIAKTHRARGHVASGRAKSESGHHRGPVEQFAAGGVDAVDRQGLLARKPGREDDGESGGEEDRRHGIRDAESNVHHVGPHRAEHRHHGDRQPVERRHVAAHQQLQRHRHRQADGSENDGDYRIDLEDQEVRGGLAHRGGQELDHPEQQGDFRNLLRDRGYASPDQYCAATRAPVDGAPEIGPNRGRVGAGAKRRSRSGHRSVGSEACIECSRPQTESTESILAATSDDWAGAPPSPGSGLSRSGFDGDSGLPLWFGGVRSDNANGPRRHECGRNTGHLAVDGRPGVPPHANSLKDALSLVLAWHDATSWTPRVRVPLRPVNTEKSASAAKRSNGYESRITRCDRKVRPSCDN